jgi:hypothetical protein
MPQAPPALPRGIPRMVGAALPKCTRALKESCQNEKARGRARRVTRDEPDPNGAALGLQREFNLKGRGAVGKGGQWMR